MPLLYEGVGNRGEALSGSLSYFPGSCGGAPISVLRQYIEQQQTPL
jgi:hypothetical protein